MAEFGSFELLVIEKFLAILVVVWLSTLLKMPKILSVVTICPCKYSKICSFVYVQQINLELVGILCFVLVSRLILCLIAGSSTTLWL